jgi:hypothetical protein
MLGFVPLPAGYVLLLVIITTLYVMATEVVKRYFHRRALG